MPPLVPATVKAKVPLEVIGEPPTEINPPVNDCPTLVTVPEPPPVAAIVILPTPCVTVTPLPAVIVLYSNVVPPFVTPKIWLAVPKDFLTKLPLL